ncbi:MAG TPA: hypothetical protein VM253_11440 [Candidatus Limnocylindrales bacterium]|jgi:hypothetical protein|nr:hypothetical protein [Candidatus Limnocylindrales bacterium]
MPGPRLRLPDLSKPQKYEHRRPKRPSHLPKRLTPPPEREGPPDLSLFLYAGLVLVIILLIVAIPYVIGYLFEVLF